MHSADRVVVAKFRHALKHRAALFDLDQMEAEQLADRRVRHRAVDDAFQETKAIVGFENIRRDDAVFLAAHNAPVFQLWPGPIRQSIHFVGEDRWVKPVHDEWKLSRDI